jgi:hypothetical protein
MTDNTLLVTGAAGFIVVLRNAYCRKSSVYGAQ